MKTRYWKVVRDFTSDRSKNMMLVLAIAIGVFGIGSILGGYSVIKREMTEGYRSTTPASATLEVDKNLSKGLIDSIKNIHGIKEAERHSTLVARMKVGDRWYPLMLFVIDDFEKKKTNKIVHLSGKTAPSIGAMLVERTAFIVMQAKEGDDIIIKTPHGTSQKIKLSGTVYDAGLAPAWQEQTGYGYISLETFHALGETDGFNQLRILVGERQNSSEYITQKAKEVAGFLKMHHYPVHEIQVPPPGKHPHQSQMNAVMTIFIIFSFLVLILGSVLVATSVASLMVKQVRQIGVMKTIGATSAQIIAIYLMMVTIICIIALIVGIPLSRVAAAGFYSRIASLLNLEIRDSSIPFWVVLVQVSSGMLIPLITAAFPVVRGSRISVRLALDHFGVNQTRPGGRWSTALLLRMNSLNEIFRLSIRNVFRQQSRLYMTLSLLAASGAMFMTAVNISKAWDQNLERIYKQRLYDLEVRLNQPNFSDTILAKIKTIPGVKTAEGWSYSSTAFCASSSFDITHTYPDKGHGSFTMQAVPIPSQLLNPTVVEGRWLSAKTTHDVVLNQLARALSPGVKIGDHISLSINGTPHEWIVIGFTEDVGTPATAYVSKAAYPAFSKVNMLRVGYKDRKKENATRQNRAVEVLLEKENMSVGTTIPVWMLHNAIAAHMKVLVNSLLAMALLMALVGTIGLMSTMSINVLERTREIGVMRAIGATPIKIKRLIIGEGLLIGMFSIVAAFVLSLILSIHIGKFIGNMAFRTPLSLTISIQAVGIWLFIIVVGSYIAALYPARRAIAITTREALTYE